MENLHHREIWARTGSKEDGREGGNRGGGVEKFGLMRKSRKSIIGLFFLSLTTTIFSFPLATAGIRIIDLPFSRFFHGSSLWCPWKKKETYNNSYCTCLFVQVAKE